MGDENFSPGSAARIRRSTRDYGQTDTGMSWNRQSSEVRSSRKAKEMGMSNYGGMGRQESMKLTGNSWLDKRIGAEQSQGMLPDIGGHKRRPPMGESFQSIGRMSGAAGFKRESVPSRGGKPDPGLTGFTYNDPNTPISHRNQPMAGNTQTSHFGMAPTDNQLPG